jgi:hypothetical protein
MKLVLTIVCGFLLAIMPAGSRESLPASPAMAAPAACGCGGKMPCCAKRSVPHPPPAPLAASNSGTQNENPLPPSAIIGWLPAPNEINLPARTSSSAVLIAGAPPLYRRDCVLLI